MIYDFLIDTHCHLNMEPFREDQKSVIERSIANNVKYMQTICTKLDEALEVRQIAENYKNVYCSVGVHPCNVEKNKIASIDDLIAFSSHEKVISLGETGLDYYHDTNLISEQKISFSNHMNASSLTKLPVIVHTRDAELDTIDIMTSEMKNAEFTGVIHCFTASYEFAKKALDLGMYISVAGIVTFKNASELQSTISRLPLDRLLVETDAPYLAPMPHRGKRNEPAYTKNTAEYLASILGKQFTEIMYKTSENAANLFSKAKFI
jgi:TatD DNase family protein